MSNPTRRDVLRGVLYTLATLPVEGVKRNWQWEPILQQCNIAIAACQELRASSEATDLALAFDRVSVYLPILKSIAHNSLSLRTQALDLAARAAILKTILGWGCVGNEATINLARNALSLSEEVFKATGDSLLWLSAYSKLAWAYSYENKDELALRTALEAEQLLLRQDPERIPVCIWGGTHSTLALMQAKTEQASGDALGKAGEQDPGDQAIAFMEFTRTDAPLEEGWIYYYSGQPEKAINALEKLIDPSTLVLKMPQDPLRRLDTINVLALSSLGKKDRSMQQIIDYWKTLTNEAQALQSEHRLNTARALYRDMTNAFPDEKAILDLRSLLPRRITKQALGT